MDPNFGKYLNAQLENGMTDVEFDSPLIIKGKVEFCHYKVDLIKGTQNNVTTDRIRRIRRLVMEVNGIEM